MPRKLVRADFEIKGNVPDQVAKFAMLQSELLGVRGWIKKTAEDSYEGVVEGEDKTLENMIKMVQKAEHIPGQKTKTTFSPRTEIKNFSFEKFEQRSSGAEKLVSCDFEIIGKLPEQLFAGFAKLQSQLLGVRGWIQKTSDDTYKGVLQGEETTMKTMINILEKTEEFQKYIKKATFTQLKKIEEFDYETFQAKAVPQKLVSVDFEIKGGQLQEQIFTSFANLQSVMLGVRGWIEKTADDTYRGVMQGEEPAVKYMIEILEKTEEFKKEITKATFTKLKEIEKYAYENFEVKSR